MSELESGECECPLCEDYSGPMSSVEAHISRKTDDAHAGEVGRMHRDALEADSTAASESGEEASEDVDGEAMALPDEGEQSGDSRADESHLPELEEGEKADVEVVDEDGEVDESSSPEVDGDGDGDDEPPSGGGVEAVEDAAAVAQHDGMMGIAVVLATVGLIAVVLTGAGGPTSEQPAETADDQDGADDGTDDGTSGGYADLWG